MKVLLKVLSAFGLLLCFKTDPAYSKWELTNEIYVGKGRSPGYINQSFTFIPEINRIYVSKVTDTISVIDTETLITLENIKIDNQIFHSQYAEGKIYAINGSDELLIIDTNINKIIKRCNIDTRLEARGIAIDHDLKRIYIILREMSPPDWKRVTYFLKIIDYTSYNVLDIIKIAEDETDFDRGFNVTFDCAIAIDKITHNIYFTYSGPDAKESSNESLFMIDRSSYQVIAKIQIGNYPTGIAINHKTGLIYVSNALSKNVSVIDRELKQVVNTIELSHELYGFNIIAVDEVRNRIFVKDFIISGDTHKVIGNLETAGNSWYFWHLAFDINTKNIYTCHYDNTIQVFDSNTGHLLQQTRTGIELSSHTLLANLNCLFITSSITDQENELTIVDLNSNSIINTLRINIIKPYKVISNSTNGLIYILSDYNPLNRNLNDKVLVYSTIKGKFLDTVINTNSQPYDIKVDEGKDYLYIITVSGLLYIYDASDLKLITTVQTDIDSGPLAPCLAIDTINNKLYVCSNRRITIIDSMTNKILNTKMSESDLYISDILILPEENKLFTINAFTNTKVYWVYDQLGIYNLDTFKEIKVINFDGATRIYDFSLVNNKLLAVADIYEGVLYFIDTISNNVSTFLNIGRIGYWNENVITFNKNTGNVYILNEFTTSVLVFRDSDFSTYISPSPPSNISVKIGNTNNFNWLQANYREVQGYNIYRSPAGANQWTRLNAELVRDTTYVDETAVSNVTYDYRIATMGLYNIEGEPSEPITATLILEPDFRLSPVLSSQSASNNTVVDYYITSESIEQFAKLIDLRVEGLPNGINYTISPNPLRPGEVTLLRFTVPSAITPGEYQFEVVGKAGNIEHRIPLKLKVVKTELAKSTIALDLGSSTIEYGSSVFATGKIIPAVSGEVSVTFSSIHGTETQTATSSSDGTYAIDFEPPSEGEWTAKASWTGNASYAGAESEERTLEALSGRTKITCTTDTPADAQLGWQMTIKGKVFPNPDVGSVTMYVKKPDGTKDTIDGLLINELGYYGYNITADQPGFWEVTASWAGNDKYLGSVSETLVVPYCLDIGRAIIAVCPDDKTPFYYTANRLGRLAYKTFSSRRFDSPRIQYFDVNTNQDLNGDGFIRDVAGEPILANIEKAIAEWAAGSVSAETPLCLYLLGIGSMDGIELSDGKRLTASHVHELLSQLESTTGCKDVVIVVDAPHSGTFVRELSRLGRCVVTSTNLGDAQYVAEGKLSFSQYFCNASCEGKSIRDAFLYAKNTLSKLPGDFKDQDPLVESEGNVIANESGDFLKTAGWYFGSSYGLQDLMPRVKSMSLASVTREGGVGKVVTNNRGVLSDDSSPTLKVAKSAAVNGINVWLKVDDAENNISSVYAVVFSPSREVLDEVELVDGDGDGKYEGQITGISDLGSYDIVGYALDESDNVSEPMKSLVVVVDQEGLDVSDQILPESFRVFAPYPNPFNPSTTLRYEIPENAHIEIVVYDILGQKVKIIEDGYVTAGVHEVVWDGKSNTGIDVGSGVYLYSVKSKNIVKQGKMVLVR